MNLSEESRKVFQHCLELTVSKGWYDPYPWKALPEARLSFREVLDRWRDGDIASCLSPTQALYVHIPFCKDRRCAFCMYGSHVLKDGFELASYVDRIHRELDEWKSLMPQNGYTNLYIGGGTPSVLPPELLDRLIKPFSQFEFVSGCENTCEMSPATATTRHLEVVRAQGINRISFGVQSLDLNVLKTVNRTFVPESKLAILVHAARALSFDDINADLMIGLPGQTPASVVVDAEKLASLGVLSLTIYRYLPGSNVLPGEQDRLYCAASECFPRVVDALSKRGWQCTNGDTSTAYLCLASPHRRHEEMRYQTRPDGFHKRSLYGLGAWANGFQGAFQYRCVSGDLTFAAERPRYSVRFFSPLEQKRLAICTMLYARQMRCDESYWKTAFGHTAEETFPEEVAGLESLGLIEREETGWRIRTTSRAESAAAIKFFWCRSAL